MSISADEWAALRDIAERRRRLQDDDAALRRELTARVTQASRAGETAAALARACGLSRESVHQHFREGREQ